MEQALFHALEDWCLPAVVLLTAGPWFDAGRSRQLLDETLLAAARDSPARGSTDTTAPWQSLRGLPRSGAGACLTGVAVRPRHFELLLQRAPPLDVEHFPTVCTVLIVSAMAHHSCELRDILRLAQNRTTDPSQIRHLNSWRTAYPKSPASWLARGFQRLRRTPSESDEAAFWRCVQMAVRHAWLMAHHLYHDHQQMFAGGALQIIWQHEQYDLVLQSTISAVIQRPWNWEA